MEHTHSALASAILITWKRNGLYAQRLVGGLADHDWTAQPVPGRVLNHPSWIFAHLNVYTPICTAMLCGERFTDPIDHPFGQKSEVSTDPHVYRPAQQLLSDFATLHTEAEESLASATDSLMAASNPLERWRAIHPTIGDMLVTLMVKHESGHLGQLSTWRRAKGLPRVAV